MIFKPPHTEEERDWPSLLIGWIVIVAALFGLVFVILSAKPEGKMSCNTYGRPVSLTRFGACKME